MPTEVRRMNYSRCNKTAERVFTSDAVTVLEIHQSFVVLGLFCRSCGKLSCSVLVATAEWCRPCAPSTPRRPTG